MRAAYTDDWESVLSIITSDINATPGKQFGYRESPTSVNNPSYDPYTRALRAAFLPLEVEAKKKKPEIYLKLGAFVYCDFPRGTFFKGYNPHRAEVFKISGIITDKHPFLYKLDNLLGKEITGTFYAQQLREAPDPTTHEHPISHIIKTVGHGKNKTHLVKWLHYNTRHNSYIRDSDLVK